MSPYRTLTGLRVALALLLASSVASAAEPLRVRIHEVSAEAQAVLDLAGAVAAGVDERADVVLLPAALRDPGAGGRWSEADVLALRDRVRRGTGLVVLGAAAAALPGSAPYAELVGRSADGESTLGGGPTVEEAPTAGGDPSVPGRGRPAVADALPLEVPDQSHPITQCLTHCLLRHSRVMAWGREPATSLAVGPHPRRRSDTTSKDASTTWSPAVWLRRDGLGLVATIAIEVGAIEVGAIEVGAIEGGHNEAGPEPVDDAAKGSPERLLLRTLAARALLHVAGRDAPVQLPGDLPLASQRIGADEPWPFPERHDFFRGRQTSGVMSHEGADWLVRPDREETEEPERVLDALKIAEGTTVADLGAGVGYFAFRMARRVGPKGKVLAADVQPEMLAGLETRRKEAGIENVEAILAAEADPKLPEGTLDLVLMVDVYHELSRPAEVMARVRRSLAPAREGRPPGRVALVEYRGEDPRVPIRPLHRTTLAQVTAELEFLGFRRIEVHEFLRHQRILVFDVGTVPIPDGARSGLEVPATGNGDSPHSR